MRTNTGEVLMKCGAPTVDQGHTWIYDFGTTNLVRILQFRCGVLQDMDVGGYGMND